jgi:hypothetical protein
MKLTARIRSNHEVTTKLEPQTGDVLISFNVEPLNIGHTMNELTDALTQANFSHGAIEDINHDIFDAINKQSVLKVIKDVIEPESD